MDVKWGRLMRNQWMLGLWLVLLASGLQANSRNVNLEQEAQQFAQGRNVAVVVGINQ